MGDTLDSIQDLSESLKEFKNCPLCNGVADIYRESDLWVDRKYSVGCERCGLYQEGHKKLSVVKKRWNRRA